MELTSKQRNDLDLCEHRKEAGRVMQGLFLMRTGCCDRDFMMQSCHAPCHLHATTLQAQAPTDLGTSEGEDVEVWAFIRILRRSR